MRCGLPIHPERTVSVWGRWKEEDKKKYVFPPLYPARDWDIKRSGVGLRFQDRSFQARPRVPKTNLFKLCPLGSSKEGISTAWCILTYI